MSWSYSVRGLSRVKTTIKVGVGSTITTLLVVVDEAEVVDVLALVLVVVADKVGTAITVVDVAPINELGAGILFKNKKEKSIGLRPRNQYPCI
jgi:hypothetical protein